MPGGLHAGLDDFRAKQEPRPDPVDDLSRFVLDRIRDQETEPAIEVMAVYDQPAGPMAHRYAGHVRRDCVVFRRIVAEYCAEMTARKAEHPDPKVGAFDRARGLRYAVRAVACRWSGHAEFQSEWSLA
jgi:hypothetical protein